MKYLLDTDICIYLIRQKSRFLAERFNAYHPGDIAISSITVAELETGVHKSQQPSQNRQALQSFLYPLTVVAFDYQAALTYGRLRAGLERAGMPIDSLDMLIAAQAVSSDSTLVINNAREFARVPDLKLEDWVNDPKS